MKKISEFKFYQGISEENLKSEVKKLEDMGYDVLNNPEFDFLNDRYILYFNKKDVTYLTKEDLAKSYLQTGTHIEDVPETQQQKIFNYAKQYWWITLAIVGIIFYYLSI